MEGRWATISRGRALLGLFVAEPNSEIYTSATIAFSRSHCFRAGKYHT